MQGYNLQCIPSFSGHVRTQDSTAEESLIDDHQKALDLVKAEIMTSYKKKRVHESDVEIMMEEEMAHE